MVDRLVDGVVRAREFDDLLVIAFDGKAQGGRAFAVHRRKVGACLEQHLHSGLPIRPLLLISINLFLMKLAAVFAQAGERTSRVGALNTRRTGKIQTGAQVGRDWCEPFGVRTQLSSERVLNPSLDFFHCWDMSLSGGKFSLH